MHLYILLADRHLLYEYNLYERLYEHHHEHLYERLQDLAGSKRHRHASAAALQSPPHAFMKLFINVFVQVFVEVFAEVSTQ